MVLNPKEVNFKIQNKSIVDIRDNSDKHIYEDKGSKAKEI
jgi:hypothetical protein